MLHDYSFAGFSYNEENETSSIRVHHKKKTRALMVARVFQLCVGSFCYTALTMFVVLSRWQGSSMSFPSL